MSHPNKPTGHPHLISSISAALGEYASDYNISAIAEDLRSRGCAKADDIDSDRFWQVVDAHALTEDELAASDPVQQLRAEVEHAMDARRGLLEEAVWRHGGVTMRILGGVHHPTVWRLQTARIQVSVRGGETRTVHGRDVQSWEGLWQLVQNQLDDWKGLLTSLRESVAIASRHVDACQDELRKARANLARAQENLATAGGESGD